MNGYAKLAEQILAHKLVSSAASSSSGSDKVVAGMLAAAGFFMFFASALLIYAAYIWFNATYSPDVAAALTACVTLLIAVVYAASAFAVVHFKYVKMKLMALEVKSQILDLIEYACEELEEPIQENPALAVSMASVAGYAAGKKFL